MNAHHTKTSRDTGNPRVLLVGGNKGSWRAADQPQHAQYLHGIESWVFATDGAYVGHRQLQAADVAANDLIICNTNAWLDSRHCKYIRTLAENRPEHVRWVTMLEGNMSDYFQPAPHIRELFDASDVVNCINRHALPFIRALTRTKVEFLGIPVPVHGISTLRLPLEQRQRRILICPWLHQRVNDYYAVRGLNVPISGFIRQPQRKLSQLRDNWKRYRMVIDKTAPRTQAEDYYRDPLLEIHTECWFPEFFSLARSMWLWMNLDDRYTWARYVLEAACLGIPIVTTRATGHGEDLFPFTTVQDAFDIETARDYAVRLLNDADFYSTVVETSQTKLSRYTADSMRQQLYTLCNLV